MIFGPKDFDRRNHPEMHFKMRSENEPPVQFEKVLADYCNAKVEKCIRDAIGEVARPDGLIDPISLERYLFPKNVKLFGFELKVNVDMPPDEFHMVTGDGKRHVFKLKD